MNDKVALPKFSPAEVDAFISLLAGIDVEKLQADFKAGNLTLEIGDVLLIAEVESGRVGYFVPEAALLSKWIGLARALMPVLGPAIAYANDHLPPPHQLTADEVMVWNFPMSNKGLFQ